MEPPPDRCCTCADPVIVFYLDGEDVAQAEDGDKKFPSWIFQLVAEDFSETCARDRVCGTCGGAAFCAHCCGAHHRGHDTAAAEEEGSAAPAGQYRRDSFCTGCRVAFCSELCVHHAGGGEGRHEVIPVDEYGGRHFVRSAAGSERWFSAFDGIEVFEDEDGNLMVPLQRRRTAELVPEPGLKYGTRQRRTTARTAAGRQV